MASRKKATKQPAVGHPEMDVIAALLRETHKKKGRRELVLGDQMPGLANDELIVLVLGKHNAVAQAVRRPMGKVKLRDLRLGVRGAALAVEELGPRMSADSTADVTADEAGLLREGGFDAPWLDGRLAIDDGALEYLHLLHNSLTPENAATVLGVNASSIRQRLGSRRLFGIKQGRAWRLPRFQFAKDRIVPGIDVVLPALPTTMHPVAIHRWFRLPHPDLEVDDDATLTPLEWLMRGLDPARVADIARGL